MNRNLWVVNTLSLSRIPLGLFAALAAANGWWELGMWIVLTGLATDYFDGYFAKRWNCGTDFGAQVLEPVCDLALTVGAGFGLLISHIVSWWVIVPVGVLALCGHLTANYAAGSLRRVGIGFMPLYFLAVIVTILMIYVVKANTPWYGYATLSIYAGVATYTKRHRLHSWLSGEVA